MGLTTGCTLAMEDAVEDAKRERLLSDPLRVKGEVL